MLKKSTETQTETVALPQIVWPAELDIKPLYEIPISKSYIARVYKTKVSVHRKFETDPHEADGYRVVVRHKTTNKMPRHVHHGGWSGYETTDIQEIRLWLDELVCELAPAKTTVKREEVDE